jgi:hypothetical protein
MSNNLNCHAIFSVFYLREGGNPFGCLINAEVKISKYVEEMKGRRPVLISIQCFEACPLLFLWGGGGARN